MADANQSIPVTFTSGGPTSYAVTFTESGLPASTSWTVTLNGTVNSSTTSSIGFLEPNGNYTYLVSAVSGYNATPTTGYVLVNGTSAGVSIAFSVAASGQYALTFSETGLPAGSSWSVLLNGTTYSTTTTGILVMVTNGSYDYQVSSVTSYSPVPANGTTTVAGASKTVSIAFYELYPLAFTETGLPSGTNWSVTLTGTSPSVIQVVGLASVSATHWSDGTSTVSFKVTNGTYTYTTSASGYNTTTGTVSVSGAAPATVGVQFSSTHNMPPPRNSSSNSTGTPLWVYIALGLIVIIIVVVIIAALMMRQRPPKNPDGTTVVETNP